MVATRGDRAVERVQDARMAGDPGLGGAGRNEYADAKPAGHAKRGRHRANHVAPAVIAHRKVASAHSRRDGTA